MNSKKNIMYITYDGILEPLGQSQVLKYISNSKNSKNIILLSFEKKNNFKNLNNTEFVNNIILKSGIKWIPYSYSNNFWFLSKIFDLFKIFYFSIINIPLYKIKIIHCRSYLPTFVICILKFFFNFKLIFDMRGFWIDERYEWGIWSKNKLIFYFLKGIEKKLIKYSDKIVVLCKDSKKVLTKNFGKNHENIFVIPTCADENQFNISSNRYWNNCLNLCHLGSISTRYDIDLTLSFFKKINQYVDSKILFINKGENDFILSKCKEYNISSSKYKIKSFDHFEIQHKINKFDFNIFFPKSGYFKKGFFPTKISESLLSGVPLISTKINSDLDEMISTNNLGFQFNNLSEINFHNFINLIDSFQKKTYIFDIRNFALKNLSLSHGVLIYDNLYKLLLKI